MAKLVLEPKTARLTRDTETFGKMDPYVKFKMGGKTKKTKTHNSGGKNPNWNDTISMDVKGATDITITVYDEDTFTDDKVGTITLNINDIRNKGIMKEWITLVYKGKPAGELYIEITYMDKSGSGPGYSSGPMGGSAMSGGLGFQSLAYGMKQNIHFAAPPPHPASASYYQPAPSTGYYQPPASGYAPSKTPGYAPTPGYSPAFATPSYGYSQAPTAYSQAPPTYSQTPPAYSQAPPTYSQTPPAYSQAPPAYAPAPSAYAPPPSAPPTYSQDPNSYAPTQAPASSSYPDDPNAYAPVSYTLSTTTYAPPPSAGPGSYTPTSAHTSAAIPAENMNSGYPTPVPTTYQPQPQAYSGPTYTPPGSTTAQALPSYSQPPAYTSQSSYPPPGSYYQQ